MTEPPDPPPTIATMRTIGMVWAVVGVLGILVGIVATVAAIVIFGVLALALGVGLVGIQHVRARSAIRASRTLTNTPPPPAAPPSAGPPEPPGPPTGPPPTVGDVARGSRGGTRADGEPEAAVGPPDGGSTDTDGNTDGSADGTADRDGDEAVVVEAEPEDAERAAERQRSSRSISDEEDGTGSRTDEEDPPRRDA